MSGITGAYHLDGRPAEREAIWRMVNALPYRGRDGQAVWTNGSIGLGHAMLHTTTESLTEKLPATNARGTLTITADTRIDNRDELIRLLGLNGRGQTIPDSGLILLAYERWGEACLDKLLGAFAFAIWDTSDRKLFCARDPFGVRPFCYFHQPGRLFAFGSEIKALLTLPGVPRRLDDVHVIDCLLGLFDDKEITELKDVRRLPPAHTLTVTPEGIRKRQYWELDPGEPVSLADDEAYAEQFRELLREAVACRMRAVVPVASELSGGLDSTFVACMARDAAGGGEPLRTVSLVFPQSSESDERSYIDAVVAQGGISPTFVDMTDHGPLSSLRDVCNGLDQGRWLVGNYYMTWHTYRAARAAGAGVLLTGIDGDTTVGHGLEILAEHANAGRWKQFAREVTLLANRHGDAQASHPVLAKLRSPHDLLYGYGAPALLENLKEKRFIRFHRAVHQLAAEMPISRWGTYWRFRRAIRDSLLGRESDTAGARKAGALELLSAEGAGYKERVRASAGSTTERSMRGAQRAALTSGAMAMTLEGSDHFAALNGIEVRHPYMDRRLIEFVLRLPPEQSCSGGWTRAIMRRAMKGVVPDAIRWRSTKANVDYHTARRVFGPEKKMLRALVHENSPFAAYVDRSRFTQFLADSHRLNGKGRWSLVSYATLSAWGRRMYARPETRISQDRRETRPDSFASGATSCTKNWALPA